MNLSKDPTIIVHDSGKPGAIVTILGGIHGNEPCGVKALQILIQMIEKGDIEIHSGKLNLIFGNPLAYILGKRYIGTDLNRAFNDNTLPCALYEAQRADKIKPFIRESSAVLDIHSSSEKNDPPCIICERNSIGIAERLPFDIRTYGWDAIHSGSTDSYANKHHRMGVCIECGEHDDPKAIERAMISIKILLQLMGIVRFTPKFEMPTQKQMIVQVVEKYITEATFTADQIFPDFYEMKKGELIGQDGVKKIYTQNDFIIISHRKKAKSGEEAFITGKIVER